MFYYKYEAIIRYIYRYYVHKHKFCITIYMYIYFITITYVYVYIVKNLITIFHFLKGTDTVYYKDIF